MELAEPTISSAVHEEEELLLCVSLQRMELAGFGLHVNG